MRCRPACGGEEPPNLGHGIEVSIDPSLWELINKDEPGRFNSLEYRHETLTRQLDLGLRKLELDVVHDPEGGRYAKPLGIEMVEKAGLPAGPPFDPDGMMLKPGLKVLHVQDIDFRTNVYTLNQALKELKKWSNANQLRCARSGSSLRPS